MSTIKGVLKQILPLESGQSKAGKDWKKQTIIIDYADGTFTKTVAVQLWGAPCDHVPAVGSSVEIEYNAESREYNGKWYTDLKGWKITGGQAQAQQSNVPPPLDEQKHNDDVPF